MNRLYSSTWLPVGANANVAIHRLGHVGIGVPPQARLHIAQTSEYMMEEGSPGAIPQLRLQSTYTGYQGGTLSHSWDVFSSSTLSFVFRDGAGGGAQNAMTLSADGLFVSGPRVSVGGQVNLGMSGERYLALGYRPLGGGQFTTTSGASGGALLHTASGGGLHLSTAGSQLINLQDNIRVTVSNTGNVGVGTVDPGLKLHVKGDQSGLRLEEEDSKWDLRPTMSGDEAALGLGLPERDPFFLAIDRGDGKIAIGTELTPESLGADDIGEYRLFVEGGILSKEVRVRTLWSDYVFAPDYALLPLPAVAAHIAAHGHLHDTPSGAHIEASGLELGSMMANQQAKIEELFLHLIALDARVQALEAENARLRAPRRSVSANHKKR
jgi:hypothetical protein